MKPAVFSCFLMNIFKIPFLLLMNLDFFQILLLRIFNVPGMQFPKDTNCLLYTSDQIVRLTSAQCLFKIIQPFMFEIGIYSIHNLSLIHIFILGFFKNSTPYSNKFWFST